MRRTVKICHTKWRESKHIFINGLIFRYEIYFVFSVAWGFGSGLFQDQLCDWRNEFSKWFTNEFKSIKFPSTGNIFSFFIDPETKKFMPWSEKVESFELDPDLPLQV